MRISTFLAIDRGGSPLQGGIERGLAKLGHEVQQYIPGRTYDLIIMFNIVACKPDYRYPEFPKCNTPVCFVDNAEYGWWTRFDNQDFMQYANAFTADALDHNEKNKSEQLRLKTFLEGKSFPYMAREFYKAVNFPQGYYPIDYPLYYQSECADPPNREKYLSRDLDLFLSWGPSHPWRHNITDYLRKSHTKCEITVVDDQQGVMRMPQRLYFDRQEASKVGVSFDGYGSGSFRMTEVLVRAPLLMAPLCIHTHAPLIDGETCIEYHIERDNDKFLDSDIIGVLHGALRDPELRWKVYSQGYEHCATKLTEKATAQYVLDVVQKHNWSKPTNLDASTWEGARND